MVVTADVPISGNRENNIRNGYSSPLRPSIRLAIDGLTHPRWLVRTAARTLWHEGIPHLENARAVRGVPALSSKATRSFVRDTLCWTDIERVRQTWKGRLIVKGILARDDVRIARELEMDGVIVSNHGGRQLDGAVAPLRVLPDLAAEAGRMAILYDGGIRRGTDVIKALASGADFVFVGRPFLYAAAIADEAGVRHAIGLLKDEVKRNLALLGCTDFSDLACRLVAPPERAQHLRP